MSKISIKFLNCVYYYNWSMPGWKDENINSFPHKDNRILFRDLFFNDREFYQ